MKIGVSALRIHPSASEISLTKPMEKRQNAGVAPYEFSIFRILEKLSLLKKCAFLGGSVYETENCR
jgi:hypothetical protein